MIFGIDLGTTNSLIGVGDELLTGTVSSNVDISKGIQVGRDVVSDTVVSSYKTNMSMGSDGELSVKCSSIILRELASLASKRMGTEVKDVVVSVPAYFSTSQREAVYKAAEMAGLSIKCVINEPTAAALYVCQDIKNIVIVYDLGGGTFDVSIVDSRMGNYSVVATDGIVLGGDDLDMALAEEVMVNRKIPIRYRSKLGKAQLKAKMRLAKEQIQKTRSAVYVDLAEFGLEQGYILTEDTYKRIVREVFGKTLDILQNVVSRNIPISESPDIVFVGGSTMCPYLREMVLAEVDAREVKSDIEPDLIVAKGVSIYAKMLEEGEADIYVEDVTKRLCIEENTGKSITIIESNTIVPCMNKRIVTNPERTNKLRIKLYQGDSLIAKNNEYIGTLEYDYGRMVEAHEGAVEITVEVKHDGVVYLEAYEILFGEESGECIKLVAR